jgi:hypothetical protein
VLATFLIFASAITLETETQCPSEAAVRASLAGLGVAARDRAGRASWELQREELTLTVLTASTATIAAQRIERRFPLGSCSELADQVALVIERATSPLGLSALPLPPEPEQKPPTPTTIGIHLGGLRLFGLGGASGVGVAAGADVWPWSASFGGLVYLQATFGESFEGGRVSTLELSRYTGGLGLAMRRRFSESLEAGVMSMAIVEHIRADAGGVTAADPIRDWRAALRAGGFGRIVIGGPLTLGVEVAVRVGSERSYRAIPATELAVLSALELEVGFNVGAIFF